MNKAASNSSQDKQRALTEFLRRKCLVATQRSSSGYRTRPVEVWLARRALERLLSCWPPTLLHSLATAAHGYVVIGERATAYTPGPRDLDGRELRSVALLHTADLKLAPERVAQALARLVDYLLGSGPGGQLRAVTDGAACSRAWQDFARRLLSSCQLAYHNKAGGEISPAEYFAWAFALYCQRPEDLVAQDPLAYRLLHSTVFSEAFWRGHPLEDVPCTPTN